MASLKEIRKKFPQYADVSDGDLLMGLHKKYYPDVHIKKFMQSIDGAQNAQITITNDNLKKYWVDSVSKPMEGESPSDMSKRLGGSAEGPVGDPGGQGMTAARSLLQGGTFGFGDEIVAGGVSALSDIPYDQALRAERDRLELGREQYPKTALGSEIGGAVALPGAVLKQGTKLLTNMLRSGSVAATEGFGYGFGTGEGGLKNRAENAAKTAAIAAPLGAAAPVAGKYVKQAYDNASMKKAIKAAGKNAPSLEELKRMATDIYNQADNVKNLPRGDFANAAQDMVTKAERGGLDNVLTPQADRTVQRITDAATSPDPNMGFRELDILRKQAQVPAGNLANRTESALGTGMVRGVDEFVESVNPKLSKELSEARAMWSRLRKSEMISEAIDKAGRQASGFENGIRTQFRAILNNPKKSRGLTEAERFAMDQVVKGTTTGNLLKLIGKASFGRGGASNYLGGSIGVGAGATVGSALGPWGSAIGAAAVPALGAIGQKGSERATQMATEALEGLVRSGGVQNVPKLSQEAQGVLEMLLRNNARAVQPVR